MGERALIISTRDETGHVLLEDAIFELPVKNPSEIGRASCRERV